MFKVLIALLMIPSLLFAAGGAQTGSGGGGGGGGGVGGNINAVTTPTVGSVWTVQTATGTPLATTATTTPGAGSGSALTVTEASVIVTTAAADIAPVLVGRSSCIIENKGNFNLHISFSGVATTASKIVYPGDYFSCFAVFGFVPTGAISGISASGPLDVLIIQATR